MIIGRSCATGFAMTRDELETRIQKYENKLQSVTNARELETFVNDSLVDIFAPSNRVIYHYTTAETFIKMFSEKEKENDKKYKLCLHFSRFDCVNDVQEGEEIFQYLEESYRDMFSEYLSSPENFIKILDKFFMGDYLYLTGVGDMVRRLGETYIACFSNRNDSLPMWNYYVKNGRYEGYNVGLNLEKIKGIVMGEVIYNNDAKKKIFLYFFNKVKELIQNKLNTDLVGNQINHSILVFLNVWRLLFKSENFEHENETRFIMCLPSNIKEVDREKYKLDFKQSNGLIVPYIKKFFDSSVLDSVTIAPSPSLHLNDVTRVTTIKFLHDRGFPIDESKVAKSQIVVRF
ncbi:MAG: DUF2971 domain-containing protein [Betaproteobacteria bacterium]|nr:DUF2971 domain-containing protein [Betaproteobacteria bacterium]